MFVCLYMYCFLIPFLSCFVGVKGYEKPTLVNVPPNDLYLIEGTDVLLNCTATGDPTPTVHWLRLDTNTSNKTKINTTTSILTIQNFSDVDVGMYICVAINSVGMDATNITYLRLNSSETDINLISQDHSVQEFNQYNPAVISCCVEGVVPKEHYWITLEGTVPSSIDINSENLIIPDLSTEDKGVYICIAGNEEMISITTTELVIHEVCQYSLINKNVMIVSAAIGQPPNITLSPLWNTNIQLGETLQLDCCSSDAIPLIQWIKLDGFIADKASHVLDTTLFIPDFNTSDNGVYVCAAINSNGFTLSDFVNVTIDNTELPMARINETINASMYDTVVMECCTENRDVQFLWHKLNDVLPVSAVGQDTATLIIPNVTCADSGIYTCMAGSRFYIKVTHIELIINVTEDIVTPTESPTVTVSSTTSIRTTPTTIMTGLLPKVKKSKKGLLETITNSIGTSLVLLTVSILGAVSLSYLCCKRGLFGSKQPKYMNMDKTRLWDVITGKHTQSLLSQAIQVHARPDRVDIQGTNSMVCIEQRLSWQQEWEQEDISLKEFLINWIIQRPYDD